MGKELKRWIFRGLKWGTLALGSGIIIVFLISNFVVDQTKGMIKTTESLGDFEPDCILVLGAGITDANVPSPILKDRLDKAIELSKSGIETTLLMSGDHGTVAHDEVNVMKNYAIEHGLLSSDIFMDHAGFSTYESLYRAKMIFGVKKLIIVTQKQHLYRALYLAKALGLEAVGVAAQEVTYGGDTLRELREILARNKDVLTALIKPLPTYLGEVIPINGNGDITNDQ